MRPIKTEYKKKELGRHLGPVAEGPVAALDAAALALGRRFQRRRAGAAAVVVVVAAGAAADAAPLHVARIRAALEEEEAKPKQTQNQRRPITFRWRQVASCVEAVITLPNLTQLNLT